MPCAGVTPGRIDSDIYCGVWGFSHTRFGGPGEKTPIAAEQACDPSAQPRRQHFMRFVGKHKCFLARSRTGPPQPLPDVFSGKRKGAAMKFATVSKSVVMGLALLLASSALAATKANLTLQNPTTINGTKLKA